VYVPPVGPATPWIPLQTVSHCTVRKCGNLIIFMLSRTASRICLTTTFTSLLMGIFPLTGCLEFPEVLKLRWCQHANIRNATVSFPPRITQLTTRWSRGLRNSQSCAYLPRQAWRHGTWDRKLRTYTCHASSALRSTRCRSLAKR
jgi:hypothetical protein